MAAHLAHKLPWGYLTQFLLLQPILGTQNTPVKRASISIGDREMKQIDHFARCFAEAVQEFRESDRSSEEERRQFNPRTWPGQREHAIGGWAGFFDSLVGGYVELNAILSDPEKIVPRLFDDGRASYRFRLMLGNHDGGHPQELAQHLQQAFVGERLKPLTADVMQVLRDHAALMFRCMYSISGVNDFVEPKWIAKEIMIVCGLHYTPGSDQQES